MTAIAQELLLETQRRLEALYAIEPQAPVTDFLIPPEEAEVYPGSGSRTLVRQSGDDVSVGLILETSVGERLSESDPRVQLDTSNLDAFCTLTEEVSHFVYVLFCAQVLRSVTELELELQGEVDKYLNATFLLSLQNEGAVTSRLREMLFRRYRLAACLTPERAERYRAANDLAFRYCGYLERLLRASRLADVARESRRFYRLGQSEKLDRISHLQ
jgi:hypothetical protein